MRTFIDTNVLLYGDDASEPVKRRRARTVIEDLITRREAVLSTQVLQEYFNSATGKLGVSLDAARERVVTLSLLDVVRIEPAMILAAIDLHRLRKVSIWDALIIRAAIAGGCSRLLTEDLNHGETFDSVRVENPFR